ncbi:MAG TPA: DUF126 domain-containing protein [Thermoproteales archaeon]|nr:DUF126 domain-containing protein [Thermoproteales archaeon]
MIKARTLVEGEVEGEALVSKVPLSFYGDIDPSTGVVVNKNLPIYGEKVAGKILIFPYGRGSTVGSYIIYRLAKKSKAPLAIINLESEPIIIVGCVLSNIVLVDKPEKNIFQIVETGDKVIVKAWEKEAVIEVIKWKKR